MMCLSASLTSPTRTHQCRQGTGLNVTINVVQESERTTGNRHVIVEPLPSKGLLVSANGSATEGPV